MCRRHPGALNHPAFGHLCVKPSSSRCRSAAACALVPRLQLGSRSSGGGDEEAIQRNGCSSPLEPPSRACAESRRRCPCAAGAARSGQPDEPRPAGRDRDGQSLSRAGGDRREQTPVCLTAALSPCVGMSGVRKLVRQKLWRRGTAALCTSNPVLGGKNSAVPRPRGGGCREALCPLRTAQSLPHAVWGGGGCRPVPFWLQLPSVVCQQAMFGARK